MLSFFCVVHIIELRLVRMLPLTEYIKKIHFSTFESPSYICVSTSMNISTLKSYFQTHLSESLTCIKENGPPATDPAHRTGLL